MRVEVLSEWYRSTLIEEDSHFNSVRILSLYFRQALLGITEDSNSLIRCNSWKPSEKLLDGCTGFQVLEQRLDGHASTFENPCTTDLIVDSLDFWAITPIQHVVHGILAACNRQG